MCLVFKLDRFSRNTEDTAHFTRILREKYCLLKALNFEDQGTPESKLFLTMMSAVSQFHAQNSAKLSIDGTKQKVLQHKCVGALPFGLTTSKQQNNTNEVGASNIVIDEQKSKIVKEIFTKYSEGMSLTDLTEYLEKRGYRNNNGNYFSRHQLYNMLRNKRYNGTYIYADKSRKRKRKYDNGVVKPKYYEKNNAIPKIIDDDLFNMVQMIIKSKENSRDVSTSISSYLLSGRLVCKCCGSKLVGDSGTSGRNHTKYRYYTCPNYKSKKNKCTTKKINADYLESAIKRLVSTISNILVETQKIKIKTDIKKKLIKSSNEIANLKKDIIRKETQIGKLVLRCIDDEQRCSIYEKQIDKFTKEVEDMKLNLEVLEIEYNLEKDDLEGTIDQMKLSYEELFNNATYTKTLISNLIKEIKCDNENINIILNLKDE